MTKAAPLVLVLLASCAAARPVALQGPAPANALDCALAQAVQLGYAPLDGGVGSGFLRVMRRTEYTSGEVAQEAATRVLSAGLLGSNRQEAEHLTITGAGGILRIQAIGLDEQEKPVSPAASTLARAQQILTACGTAS